MVFFILFGLLNLCVTVLQSTVRSSVTTHSIHDKTAASAIRHPLQERLTKIYNSTFRCKQGFSHSSILTISYSALLLSGVRQSVTTRSDSCPDATLPLLKCRYRPESPHSQAILPQGKHRKTEIRFKVDHTCRPTTQSTHSFQSDKASHSAQQMILSHLHTAEQNDRGIGHPIPLYIKRRTVPTVISRAF